MKSVGAFVKKQDRFGQPVTINYRGDDTFRTTWGATLSLAQKILILILTVRGVLDLFSHQDPNITQYKIYDKRNDDQ